MSSARIVAIDVGTGRVSSRPAPHPTVASGLLGALLLSAWQSSDQDQGPVPVVLAGGGLHGVPTVGGATAVVCGRSPQSGGYAEARVEGALGGALRSVGLSALVVRGIAPRSAVVVVEPGVVRTVDGEAWAGWDVASTTHALRSQWPGAVVGVIGPAGESRFAGASIVFDYGFPTATGGLGAALGALNVKALVICGAADDALDGDPRVRDAVREAYAARMDSNPLTAAQFAEPGFGVAGPARLIGYQAARNFAAASSPGDPAGKPGAQPIPDPAEFTALLAADAPVACPGCPQRCIKMFPAPGLPAECGRLHQQAVAIWVDQLAIRDVSGAVAFNAACHVYGLEHVSVGALLGALAESADHRAGAPAPGPAGASALDPALDPVGGRPFRFGDGRRAAELVENWGRTPPGGAGLSLRAVAAHLGSAEQIVLMRGMPVPPFDPRGSQGLAVGMALNPAGPRYDVLEHDIDFDPRWAWQGHVTGGAAYGMPPGGLPLGTLGGDRVRGVIGLWQLWSGLDALGVCIFAGPPTRELSGDDVLALVGDVTGESTTMAQLTLRGRQRLAVQRRVNLHWGVTERVETLPDRFFDEPVAEGPLSGLRVDRREFAAALATVRAHFGWGDSQQGADDRDGIDDLMRSVAVPS